MKLTIILTPVRSKYLKEYLSKKEKTTNITKWLHDYLTSYGVQIYPELYKLRNVGKLMIDSKELTIEEIDKRVITHKEVNRKGEKYTIETGKKLTEVIEDSYKLGVAIKKLSEPDYEESLEEFCNNLISNRIDNSIIDEKTKELLKERSENGTDST